MAFLLGYYYCHNFEFFRFSSLICEMHYFPHFIKFSLSFWYNCSIPFLGFMSFWLRCPNNWLCRFLGMAESKPGLRKPVFTKVEQLRPGTSGHTLTVKVVSTKMVLQKGRADGPQVRQMRIAECLVGDETGMIIFTARNDQGMCMD